MRRAGRSIVAGVLVGLALAGAADAQQAQKKKQPSFAIPPPRLRTLEPPKPSPFLPPPKQPAKPASPSDPGPSQALPPHQDTTARMGGLEAERAGGAQCRTSCAQAYYFCLSNQDDASCAASRTQCVVACPTNSSSF
jgi:hypothetical protein